MAFFQSSQHTDWIFPREKIESLGTQWNEYARKKVSQHQSRTQSIQTMVVINNSAQGDTKQDSQAPEAQEKVNLRSEWLTTEDEKILLLWSELKIMELCRGLGFHRALTSTAVNYFKRFFTRASVLDYPPHEIM